ncbi:MAG: nicotinate-nucleotide--dimethylbenzimidazole phosphoribosyltransferase [Kordiimonas sp.]|nr:nicotinate-nucleotide--dimethylbenzimidazole phosphoribosyltransferase [Kordiimonas sp.]
MENADALSGMPFDDVRGVLKHFPAPDEAAMAAVKGRNAELLKPLGSLGRLEELAVWLAGWQGESHPHVNKPQICIFAAEHGVAAKIALPVAENYTSKMVEAMASGGAAVNQLALQYGAGLQAFDLAVDMPTDDMTEKAALSEQDCAASMAFGMEAIATGCDVLCIGTVSRPAATLSAVALCCLLFGGDPEDWCEGFDKETENGEFVRMAVQLHQSVNADPFDILRRVGGREMAAVVGAVMAARTQRIPVILDDFVVLAAAGVLAAITPDNISHCLVGSQSRSIGARKLIDRLGQEPLTSLDIDIGQGVGATLGLPVLKAAADLHNEMATHHQMGMMSDEQ